MNYSDALKAMECGFKVKLPKWKGYWYSKDGVITIHTKDNEELSIDNSKDFTMTVASMVRKDWYCVELPIDWQCNLVVEYINLSNKLSKCIEAMKEDSSDLQIDYLPLQQYAISNYLYLLFLRLRNFGLVHFISDIPNLCLKKEIKKSCADCEHEKMEPASLVCSTCFNHSNFIHK